MQMHFLPSRQNYYTHYNSPHNVYSSLMKRHHDLYRREGLNNEILRLSSV